MRVLIIGAGGFVGKYLIDEFKKDNYEVVACDIGKGDKFDNSVIYRDLDILDSESVNLIVGEFKPDFLINLAAISSVGLSWKIPAKTMDVNVNGTINILEAIRTISPETKVLIIGSSEEYAMKDSPLKESDEVNANNPYGISKATQEKFARLYKEKYNMKIVCTRSFNHTGIGQLDSFVIPSFCKQVAEIDKAGRDGIIKVGNLSAYRDFSDVRDIVKVYKALLENETEDLVYNVGSGKAYKIEEILEYIISLSSQKILIEIDQEKVRPVDTPYICADNSKTAKYFNNTDIKQTIREMFEYYKNSDY